MNNNHIWISLVVVTLFGNISCKHISTGDSQILSARMAVALPHAHAPTPRALPAAVWTGGAMIVWGGVGAPNDVLDRAEGAIYFPAAKRWQEIPKVELASRFHHSAVWTGKYLAVWGGVESRSKERLSSGWLYNPDTKEWRPISGAQSPSPRSGHSAVWTGKYMIVWGGEADSGVLQDGAMYDPETDTWLAIATEAAPAARSFHTVAWSGTSMLVWGGLGEGGDLNTGGVFDPATNSWKQMSNLGAPGSRVSHSAVWTGSKMIVWGGRKDSDQFLNDGALYDPIKDKWTPLAAAQKIASPRELHTAVWTDKEMVIWGGQNGESILSGGAAFNPEKNTWRAIRDNRRSVARSQHSAVWTGSSMLVFGGRSKTGAFVGNKVGVEIFFENPAESASGN